MLKHLHIQNFTVFADADFEFVQGLNVLVGTNGTGKSHVLKLGYAVELAYAAAPSEKKEASVSNKQDAQIAFGFGIISRLSDVFLLKDASKLARRSGSKISAPNIKVTFGKEAKGILQFSISESTTKSLTIDNSPIISGQLKKPVFIPAKEVLSLSRAISLSEDYNDLFDLTYTEVHKLLLKPTLKSPPAYIANALESLMKVILGNFDVENGQFYFASEQGTRFEIDMVAEGYRKLGALAILLANGNLSKENTLYWDEPEANLNPALLRELAKVLVELARQDFQIILATHSMGLLKEFHILSRQKDAKLLRIKYFGLNAELGEATRVISTSNFEYLPDVVALAEELKQADELEEIFIREDQEYHANNRGKE